ncbi:MAG: MoaD/ThiS family protein [Clostridia bacterium]
MISIKLFGLFRQKTENFEFELTATRLDECLKELEKASGIPVKDLKNGVIFVNKIPLEKLKGFKTPLKDGDTIAILSPVSGG